MQELIVDQTNNVRLACLHGLAAHNLPQDESKTLGAAETTGLVG